jgi:hypothetical protein
MEQGAGAFKLPWHLCARGLRVVECDWWASEQKRLARVARVNCACVCGMLYARVVHSGLQQVPLNRQGVDAGAKPAGPKAWLSCPSTGAVGHTSPTPHTVAEMNGDISACQVDKTRSWLYREGTYSPLLT